ncbi:MAG: hypothetical protein KBT03_04605 [Bacteroidales bacterium]|nr:hypothetical protein [Candidatus Scybalousia scybalohippi]
MNTRGLKKADDLLNREADRVMDVVYTSTILALHRNQGWGRVRISHFMDKAQQVFNECGEDDTKSMIQLCDEETGIEFCNEKGECWKDDVYLNDELWKVRKAEYQKKPRAYQIAYLTRVRQKQMEWLFPTFGASIAIALHRKEKWGYDKINALIGQMYDVAAEYGQNLEKLKKAIASELNASYEDWKRGR